MRLPLLLIAALLFATTLSAQDFFVRYFDNGGNERARFCTVAHGRIVLSGSTTGQARDRLAGVTQFLDLDGNSLQSVRMDTDRRTFLFGAQPLDAADATAGWLVGGDQNNFATVDDVALYQLDPEGRSRATFGWGHPQEDEQLRRLLLLRNGDFLALGNVGTSSRATIRRFSGTGQSHWYRAWDIPETQFNVFQNGAEVDDGILVTGYSTRDNRFGATIVAKFSPAGDLLWSFLYDYPRQSDEGIRSLAVSATGEIFVVTRVIGEDRLVDALIIRLSATGEVLGRWLLSGAGDLVINDCHYTGEGNLLLAGGLSLTANGLQALVAEIDPTAGMIVRQRTVGNAQVSALLDIEPAPGGGYFLAGYGTYCGDNSDMLLAYLNGQLENPRESCPPAEAIPLELVAAPLPTRRRAGVLTEPEDPSVVIAPSRIATVAVTAENCPLIDLDADDSSMAPSVGGFAATVACYSGPLPITDEDLTLDFPEPLPTRILLSILTPEPGESLTVPPERLSQTQTSGSPNIIIRRTPDQDAETFLALLREVRYEHAGPVITAGKREIRGELQYPCGYAAIFRAHLEMTNGDVAPLALRDTTLCADEELTLDATTAGATTYTWRDGAHGATRKVSLPGVYVVDASNACRSRRDSIVVTRRSSGLGITPQAIAPVTLCAGDSVALDLSTPNVTEYLWDDGFVGAQRTLNVAAEYRVTLSNPCASATTAFEITTEACCAVYLPTAFSPNEDGINDRFLPLAGGSGCAGIRAWSLVIYDRWGNEVFAGRDVEAGWDGTVAGSPAPPGTYTCVVRYFDGLTAQQQSESLVLLR